MQKFSVLASVYFKENPDYFKAAMDSVINQTVKPDEIVLVEDGELTPELYAAIDEYEKNNEGLFKIVRLERNSGLGVALAEGLLHCSNELVARMDTDDISRSDRFERQLAAFDADPDLDICGSHVLEFEDSIDNIVAKRTVPITDAEIKKYQKKRDAFNHPAVTFKKSAVLAAGNYKACPLMEDTYLWVRMFINGAKAANIDDYLLYFRVGKDMFERRGGFAYYKKYKAGRKAVRKTGYIGWLDYRSSLIIQFIVALMPNKLRGFVFKKILHR